MQKGEIVRWLIEPLERERRGVDERVALAAPWLRRRLSERIERAPAGSRIRKAALTRVVRSAYAAVNRDDYEAMRAPLHPEVELYPPGRGRSGLGFEPVYRGPGGVTEFVKQWKSGFSRFRYEPREIADPGGPSFAIRLGMIGTMLNSDTELSEEYGTVITLRPGAGREPDARRSHPRAHLPTHPPLTRALAPAAAEYLYLTW